MAALAEGFDVRAELKAQMAKRDALEEEAEAVRSELDTPPASGGAAAGVKGSLIDAEGFPRGDVDAYRVRERRGRLAHIQTDHRAVMKRIEELLPLALAPSGGGGGARSSSSDEAPPPRTHAPPLTAFAVVTAVLAESPAAKCGLLRGDQVLKYGGCTSLAGVKSETMAHVNQRLPVLVARDFIDHPITLNLVPEAWRGQGLLGCVFSPPPDANATPVP